MKEIVFDYSRHPARNAQHLQFATDILGVVTETLADTYQFAKPRENAATVIMAEQDCFKTDTAYAETAMVESTDRTRDALFYLYSQITRAYAQYAQDEAKRNAGILLNRLFVVAGDAPRTDYAAETAILDDMIEKMETSPYREALATLGIQTAPTEMKASNDAFNEVYLQRSTSERVRSEAQKMKTLRPQTDAALDNLFKTINAIYMVKVIANDDLDALNDLGDLIDKVNDISLRFQKTIRMNNQKGKKEDNGF